MTTLTSNKSPLARAVREIEAQKQAGQRGYFTPIEDGPEPTAETLAATDAGIVAALDELGIVRAIAVDNEVRDRCYEEG